MALTREQVIERVAERLIRKRIVALTFQQIGQTFSGMNASDRESVVLFVQTGAQQRLGMLLMQRAHEALQAAALNEATARLMGDSLSIGDLQELLDA